MIIKRSCLHWTLLAAALALTLAPGCKKKPAPQAAADSSSNAAAPEAAAAATPAAQAQPAPRKIDFTPIQKMVQARDYDNATKELILLQRAVKDPTPDQSMALANQMRTLQKTLAGAAAGGDPNAKAAIDRLTANMSGR